MTSIRMRGMTIDSEGEGPPVVMLHGLGGTSSAKTVILNRCGHWTPIEKSKECRKLLSEFVRAIPV
jgi:3-oxoadipate enol-lactonase